jgi:hypothetical protein
MHVVNVKNQQPNITSNDVQHSSQVQSTFSGRQTDCVEKISPYVVPGLAIFCGYIAGIAAGYASCEQPKPLSDYASNSTFAVDYSECSTARRDSMTATSIAASITTILFFKLLNCCCHLK